MLDHGALVCRQRRPHTRDLTQHGWQSLACWLWGRREGLSDMGGRPDVWVRPSTGSRRRLVWLIPVGRWSALTGGSSLSGGAGLTLIRGKLVCTCVKGVFPGARPLDRFARCWDVIRRR